MRWPNQRLFGDLCRGSAVTEPQPPFPRTLGPGLEGEAGGWLGSPATSHPPNGRFGHRQSRGRECGRPPPSRLPGVWSWLRTREQPWLCSHSRGRRLSPRRLGAGGEPRSGGGLLPWAPGPAKPQVPMPGCEWRSRWVGRRWGHRTRELGKAASQATQLGLHSLHTCHPPRATGLAWFPGWPCC